MTKVIPLRGCRSAVKTTPTTRHELDAIQLHAQAENALSMALYYLRQPRCNIMGASRKAVIALRALHQMVDRPDVPSEAIASNNGRG